MAVSKPSFADAENAIAEAIYAPLIIFIRFEAIVLTVLYLDIQTPKFF